MRVVLAHAATSRQMRGVSSIAAPLLATSAIAATAVIVQEPGRVAFPNLCLALLVAATGLLVTSVNASIWVSYYQCEPTPGSGIPVEADYVQARIAYQALAHWVKVARVTYTSGLYALWLGIAAVLLPEPFTWWRMPAAAVALLAIAVDLLLPRLAPKSDVEPVRWLTLD